MGQNNQAATARFRVWITAYHDWQPENLRAVPPRAIALEPAEEGTMSAEEAIGYAGAFNRAALLRPGKIWAVVLPVTVRYDGDPQPGQMIAGARKSPPCACQASAHDGPPPREYA